MERNKELIRTLHECAAACNYCASACLGEQEVSNLTKCIQLDIDCAQICVLTASFVARGSVHAKHVLKECVEICEQCAQECEKHAQMGMEHCRECADACRKCAEACRQAMAA